MATPTYEAEFLEYIAVKTPWLRRVAFLLCQDWHRADDLVQTALTRLYVNWPKVARARHPDAYARATLVNCFLAEQRTTWWRRVAVRGEPVEPNPPPPGPDPDLRLDVRSAPRPKRRSARSTAMPCRCTSPHGVSR
ncbi:MAG TPA: sigma factor [Actinocrinis sp.]|nr:sigma factor [Actinocrinis sp.]